MNPLAWLNLLNLLIIPLGYLIHRLGAQIDAITARLLRLEREAITKPDVEFWQHAAQTTHIPATRREK